MFAQLHQFTEIIVKAYSDLWEICTSTISEVLGDNFTDIIDLIQGWLEGAWFVGDALSGLLTFIFDTQIITLVLGSVGLFMGWQLITWLLNLVT